MKKNMMKIILTNAIGLVSILFMAFIYFIQPTNGLGLNNFVKNVAFGIIILTFIVVMIINLAIYLVVKFDLKIK